MWLRLAAALTAALAGGTSRLDAATGPVAAKSLVICDSAAVEYTDLAQLRRAATSVVVLRPTGATRVRNVAMIPFTISTVAVRKRVAGRHPPPRFGLRQTGTIAVQDCETLVSRGSLYLAYLAPFRWRMHGPAVRGQYVAVGLFEHAGPKLPPDRAAVFRSVNGQQSLLPARISIAQARRSARPGDRRG
jgi:hypothetical protein